MTAPFRFESSFTTQLDPGSMERLLQVLGIPEEPRFDVTFHGRHAVRLRTGKRPAGVSRAEWRAQLRVNSWLRRRQRRTGIPAATVAMALHLPNARVGADVTDGPICPSLGRPLTDDEVCDIAVASGWIEDTPEARAAYLAEGREET